MTTFDSMTREQYNSYFIRHLIDESFLEIRKHGALNIVNLECSNKSCGGAHVQIYNIAIQRDKKSKFQLTCCIICGKSMRIIVKNQIGFLR